MLKRFLSTILLWSAIIGPLVYFGPIAALWLIAILSLGTQYEFYCLMEKMGRKPFKALGTTLGVVMIIVPYYANEFVRQYSGEPIDGLQSSIIAITIVACCLRILVHRKVNERIETLGSTLVGLIYVPFMLTFMARLLNVSDDPSEGLMLILWLIVVAKFCDVGALLAGKAFGRHKMSPDTSPGKTWEGAVGGCLTSIALGYAFVHFGGEYFPPFVTPIWAAVIALPISILSIISDLVESMIKRQAGQKDSGNFIPGIGGAFDLGDSLILTAPTAFLLFGLLQSLAN